MKVSFMEIIIITINSIILGLLYQKLVEVSEILSEFRIRIALLEKIADERNNGG